ncbi:MAG: DMT family transporter [bacterium]
MTDAHRIHATMGLKEWGLLLVLALLWGPTFYFTEIAITALPPLTVVALRVGMAALTLHLLLGLRGRALPLGGGLWLRFLGMGLLNNAVPFSLIVWGQQHIDSGLAAILTATTPISTVVMAHLLTADEKIARGRLAGVVTGVCGVALMVGPAAVVGLGNHLWGQMAVLGATVSYALAGIFGRRFTRIGVPPIQAATGQLTASVLLLAPVAALVERPWLLPVPDWPVWQAIATMALFSTALAYVVYFRILATAGATNLMLVTLLMPVIALLLGGFLLGERLEASHFAGMALIGFGLAAIDGRPFKLLSRGRAGHTPERPPSRLEARR